jgi:recombination associated protein RdgC
MGFLNGRITYVRYRVSGSSPLPFDDALLERAQQHAIGRHGAADPTDGVAVG